MDSIHSLKLQDCPIAHHSPLPGLQNLVKLFQPRAVSPNTVVSDARELDYFLLPDFFKDRIQPDAYAMTIQERDVWFIDRYGKDVFDDLKGLQTAGENLLPDMGDFASTCDEYLPDDLCPSKHLDTGREASNSEPSEESYRR